MNAAVRTTDWLSTRIYLAASSLLFGAVFLRSLVIYGHHPAFFRVLGLLGIWLAAAVCEPVVRRFWPDEFPFYLALQTALVILLLSTPGYSDFFAALLLILSMQVMLHLNHHLGQLWIGFCALALLFLLQNGYDLGQAMALTLVYTAANFFFGAYSLAMRRAQAAEIRNQSLASELWEANTQLKRYSDQLEGLAVARERYHLARELHDSVTQTVFSMTLTVRSAMLLIPRDPSRVKAQLDRLEQQSRRALAELQVLVAGLGPEQAVRTGLVSALRSHLSCSQLSNQLSGTLSVSLEVTGDQALSISEELELFRIIQEALNNTAKHSQASHAQIRINLSAPFWVEIEDKGQGFDLEKARESTGVGLVGMRERAAEMGWKLEITSSPGAGTRIRVEKVPNREVQTG